MVVYIIIKCYRLKNRKREIGHSEESKTTKLRKLRSLVSTDSVNDEEELPHRLVASLSEYKSFDDHDHAFTPMRETEFDSTY